MDITYNTFEEMYLHQAKVLTQDIAESEAAKKLCKATYQALNGQDPANRRKICVTLAEIRYSNLFENDCLPDTAQVVKSIYGLSETAFHEKWISFEDCLNNLYEVLSDLPLVIRMIAAFRVLGWNNEAIAEYFTAILTQLEESSKPVIELSDVAQLLSRFRELSVNHVRALSDNAEKWLVELILKKSDVTSEFKTWTMIEGFLNESDATRFARRSTPERDKYGVLRDQWDSAKEYIINKLELEKFTVRMKLRK